MLGAMDDVVYERMNFNFDYKQFRHPKWITERHFVYHLCRDDRGYLMCVRDNKGEPIRSPRYACVTNLRRFCDMWFSNKLDYKDPHSLPSTSCRRDPMQ